MGDAIQEMLAFPSQRFGRFQGDVRPLGLARGGHAVLPLNFVVVDREFLLPGQAVVEYGHHAVAHHHEFLFLERMQPGDEDVRLEPRGERKVGHGHVRDPVVQIIAPDRLDDRGKFPGQGQDHGKIVRGERPQGILLAAYLSKIEPVGIDVVDTAQLARVDHVLEFDEGRMVVQKVPHHEDEFLFPGERDEFLAMAFIKDQRLFHIGVLAGRKRLAGYGIVGLGRGGDDDALDVITAQGLAQARTDGHLRVLFAKLRQNIRVVVHDEPETAQIMEDPDQVFPPVARTDDRETSVFAHGSLLEGLALPRPFRRRFAVRPVVPGRWYGCSPDRQFKAKIMPEGRGQRRPPEEPPHDRLQTGIRGSKTPGVKVNEAPCAGSGGKSPNSPPLPVQLHRRGRKPLF